MHKDPLAPGTHKLPPKNVSPRSPTSQTTLGAATAATGRSRKPARKTAPPSAHARKVQRKDEDAGERAQRRTQRGELPEQSPDRPSKKSEMLHSEAPSSPKSPAQLLGVFDESATASVQRILNA